MLSIHYSFFRAYLRCEVTRTGSRATIGSKVELFGRGSSLVLGPGGSLTAVEPVGPLSIAKEGQWELDADDRMVKLDFKR